MGKWLRAFHKAARDFERKRFKMAFQIERWDEGPNKWQKEALKCPDLPETPESFGIIHGDFHHENLVIDRCEDTKLIRVFDFENIQKSWFLVDLGSAIFQAIWKMERDRDADSETLLKDMQEFTDAFCLGYTGGEYEIDRKLLLKFCNMRRDAIRYVYKQNLEFATGDVSQRKF